MSDGFSNLVKNSFVYESCLEWVDSVAGDPERCLGAISDTAALAWHHHPGRFADGALENHALRIGHGQLPTPPPIEHLQPSSGGGRSRTLHVATEIHPIGGHSRVLAKWAGRDRTATHAVVLTAQPAPVPAVIEQVITAAGGQVIALPPSAPKMLRAAALRDFARRFDRVILHTHPHDVVPVVAFAQADAPPVAVFNHAHFSFCLSTSVADLVVNSLDYFRTLSDRYRFARRTLRLTGVPGLVALTPHPIDKSAAKASLGFESTTKVVLAIAQEPYFAPMPGYDFFATARKLLQQNPTMHLVVVGVRRRSGLLPADLRDEPRCHCVGPVVDPIPYYQAADLCLESFPMPSLGAVVEAVAFGEAFVVPVYGHGEGILRLSQEPVLTYPKRPKDEREYIAYVTELLSNLAAAHEHAQRARVSMLAIERNWESELARINDAVDRLQHTPAEIPVAARNESEDSRLLADLSPSDLRCQLDELLPFMHAARAHVKARRFGISRPRVLGRLGRLAWRGVRAHVRRTRH